MSTTVVGVFSDFTAALNTSPELASAGFAREDVSIVAQDSKGEYAKFVNAETLPEPETGVGTGATVGGIGGFLLGLAAFAIPGIGPIVAAGPLVTAFAGATTGQRSATLTLLYPEGHERKVGEIRHDFTDIVRSMMHGHAKGSCVEVFAGGHSFRWRPLLRKGSQTWVTILH